MGDPFNTASDVTRATMDAAEITTFSTTATATASGSVWTQAAPKNRAYTLNMNPTVKFRLGLRAFKAKRLVQAKKLFRSVFEESRSAECFDAGFNLALVHRALKEYNSALTLHKKLEKLDPDDFENVLALGNLYSETRQFMRALRKYHKALKLKPRDERLYYNIGITYEERGDREKALVWYNRSLRLNQDYVDAGIRKVRLLEEMNRSTAALSTINQVLERVTSPNRRLEIANEKGCLLVRLGRYKDALLHFRLTRKLCRKAEMKKALSRKISDLERRV